MQEIPDFGQHVLSLASQTCVPGHGSCPALAVVAARESAVEASGGGIVVGLHDSSVGAHQRSRQRMLVIQVFACVTEDEVVTLRIADGVSGASWLASVLMAGGNR